MIQQMKSFSLNSLVRAAGLLLCVVGLSGCVANEQTAQVHLQAAAIKSLTISSTPTTFQAVNSANPSQLIALSAQKIGEQEPVVRTDVTGKLKDEDVLDDVAWFDQPEPEIEEFTTGDPNRISISSQYGKRKDPKRGRVTKFHHGIDIRAPKGTPAFALKGGKVLRASSYSGYGLTVEIRQYDGMIARYAHLNKIMVKAGDSIDSGIQIGEVGRTGRTTGSHLHFELLKNGGSVNPTNFVKNIAALVRNTDTKTASK